MKIFHTSDWHLGKIINGFYMTEDQEFIMDEIYKKIKEEQPHVVIIAGDLYDRSVPPVQAIELLNKVLKKIVLELNTPIIALAGNHDSNERIDFASDLLRDSGLYISGTLKKDIEKIIINDEYGPVNFYPIPFADPPIVRELFQDETIKTYDDAMKKIVDSISEKMNKDERNIVIAHGYVTYIKENNEVAVTLEESDSEKPLSIGGTDYINANHFNDFNYTALGHLHGPQKVGSNKIRYAGSLLKYSFSEVNQRKGITIVNMDGNGDVETNISEYKPRRDFRIITGELEELIKENVASIENRDDYIKVILKDKGELLDPMAKIRSVYPNVMELVREDRIRNTGKDTLSSISVKETSKINLFESFYEEMVGEKCSQEGIEFMKDVIEKIERGNED